ncbi:MAG: PhoH family protein [Candidatus Kapaibacteriales bacterium]
MNNIIEKVIEIEEVQISEILGYNDSFINAIESRFTESTIIVRGSNIIVRGTAEDIAKIESVVQEMVYMFNRNGSLTGEDISMILSFVSAIDNANEGVSPGHSQTIIYSGFKNIVKAKNPKQREYFRKVMENDLVFSIGPAGTGKTFIAVALALGALKRNEVSRIILSRPAVEAGESLGFLPGDLSEKIDPYLRPLMDSLQDMLSPDKLKVLKERGIIEINPLAYMRGRTLNNSFVILDEAQNATSTQMKMFLTRLGQGSKAIITGDKTQIDLPKRMRSGLIDAEHVLRKVDGIDFVYFDQNDVVRHKLVADIIKAYDRADSLKDKSNEDFN